ncbi:MAG: hypothetical protein ACFB5Z_06985 [Elainellaceae cyanobacterium]
MILETSEVMRSLAELYDVPELAYFSSKNYCDHIGTSHGVKGVFDGVHQTASGSVARKVRLRFDDDGSAQGSHGDRGGSLSIVRS